MSYPDGLKIPAAGLVAKLASGGFIWAYRDGDGRVVCNEAPTELAARAAMAESRAWRERPRAAFAASVVRKPTGGAS